jgi:release factor glutamine methyltransferase
MTTRWEITDQVADRLAAAGVPSPDVDAERIVEHVVERFGWDLLGCDTHVLEGLVARREAREPLQQVLGRTWFRHLEVACVAGVFVPRPETEVVAGLAIDAAARVPSPVVVDACTGSGVIALAVASEVPGARVTAVDRSSVAVDLARENLARLAAAAPPHPWKPGPWLAPGAYVEVVQGDLLGPVPADLRGRVDVLVSNPPYLPAADAATWEPEVADHDPHDALVGGADGHEIVDELLRLAATWLRPGGTVVVEIDDRRGADAAAVATAAGLVAVRVAPDLTGRDRAVVARRPDSSEEP